MNCPVCKYTGIKTGATTCPKCKSDLEIFQLLENITDEKQGKSLYVWIFGILLVFACSGWAYTYYYYTKTQKVNNDIVNDQINRQLRQIDKLKSDNDALLLKIIELQKNNNETMSATLTLGKNKETIKKNSPSAGGKLTASGIPGMSYYVIEKGETLQLVAEKVYGNKAKYIKIMSDNNISNADQVVVGQKLKIYK